MEQRSQSLFLAITAEQAERYDDVVDELKKVATNVELTSEEMCLLAKGYKNLIHVKRESLKKLSIVEEEQKSSEKDLKKIKEYKVKIEKEMTEKCEEVLSLVDQHLIPSSSSPQSSAFFYKMKGDYYRYLAEINVGQHQTEIAEKALKAYQRASSIAELSFERTHPVRLGVALNLSVLYYDILEEPDIAYWLAKDTYDESTVEFDKLNNTTELSNITEYEDSTVIMQLLKDNIVAWKTFELENQGIF